MFDPNEKKDNIDKVKESLYSKTIDNIFVKRRHDLQNDDNIKVPTAWENFEEETTKKKDIPYSKILLGAFVFFVLALGFAFSKFFLGANVVSGNNIDILVSGPISIAGGEQLPLDIEVKNNNKVDLKTVDLRVEYPAGTKSADDQTVDLPRYSEVLGDINVGKSVDRLVKSVLFGEENSQETIKITVEYRVNGSNAVFSKEKDFAVLISSSPVNVSVDGPTQVNANQLTDFSVNINSNSTNIVKNLILKIDYPFGFTLSSSDPKPINSDGSVFSIGDLAPGAKRTLRITGILQGQDGDQRALKFTVGAPNSSDNTVIDTPLAIYTSTVSIQKSSIGFSMAVNGQTGNDIPISVGNNNLVNITWQNNLNANINNMAVKIKLDGLTLDPNTINPGNGFYNSSDNSITFDKNSDPSFSTISPNDEGNINFSFGTLVPSASSNISFSNAAINFDISVVGNQDGSNGNVGQVILYSDKETLKLTSNLKLLSRGFRTIGPFENSGPFPPKVNNQTTYTITWTATDSFNNVSGAKVSAFLAPNITWTGYTSPASENITYDKGTGEVDRNIGNMRYGIGDNVPPKSVSFQVSVTPSITQVGQEINLLNEATISGTDVYSGARIGEVKSPVTTTITSDPEYVDGAGIVIK